MDTFTVLMIVFLMAIGVAALSKRMRQEIAVRIVRFYFDMRARILHPAYIREKTYVISFYDTSCVRREIHLPYSALRAATNNRVFYAVKKGVKSPVYYPPGVPFLVSSDMLGVDSIIEHDVEESCERSFSGAAVPNG